MNRQDFHSNARRDPRPVQTAADSHAHPADGSSGAVHHPEADGAAALFPKEMCRELESRWLQIQTGFVDRPRESVQHADELVSDAIRRLLETFGHERAKLESQWSRDGDVSTEDLRVAMQRYRSFFQRLLHV